MPTSTPRYCLPLVLTLFAAMPGYATAAAHEITDAQGGWSFVVPDEMEEFPEALFAYPQAIHAYIDGDPEDLTDAIGIVIHGMPGTVRQTDQVSPTDVPAGTLPADATVSTVTWGDFSLPCVRFTEQDDYIEMVHYNIIVPLKPKAIMVTILGGNLDLDDEVRALVASFIPTIAGETNWLTRGDLWVLVGQIIGCTLALGVGIHSWRKW